MVGRGVPVARLEHPFPELHEIASGHVRERTGKTAVGTGPDGGGTGGVAHAHPAIGTRLEQAGNGHTVRIGDPA
jgi:hypothetical protein